MSPTRSGINFLAWSLVPSHRINPPSWLLSYVCSVFVLSARNNRPGTWKLAPPTRFEDLSLTLFCQRRAVALNAVAVARIQARALTARTRSLALATSQYRTYKTSPRQQYAFHSQLENTPTPSAFQFQQAPPVENPQTLVEKIAQQYAVGLAPGKKIKAGDYITLAPHHCMSHDNTWPIAKKFLEIGATKIHDNKQLGM